MSREAEKKWGNILSVGSLAQANFEESCKLLDDINAELRKLNIQKEWCEEYLVRQMHTMHDDHVFLSAPSFGEYFHNFHHMHELTDEERESTQVFLQLVKERVFSDGFRDHAKLKNIQSDLSSIKYTFWYDYDGLLVGFTFPMYANVTYNNFLDCRYEALYIETDKYDIDTINTIAKGFNREPVAKELEVWLTKHHLGSMKGGKKNG